MSIRLSDIKDQKLRQRISSLIADGDILTRRGNALLKIANSPVMVRQKTEILNRLETEVWRHLRELYGDQFVHPQAVTFVLANGVRYTPDFTVMHPLFREPGIQLICYEAKGFMRDDAAVKIKVAARTYPHIKWFLIWKKQGKFNQQEILP